MPDSLSDNKSSLILIDMMLTLSDDEMNDYLISKEADYGGHLPVLSDNKSSLRTEASA